MAELSAALVRRQLSNGKLAGVAPAGLLDQRLHAKLRDTVRVPFRMGSLARRNSQCIDNASDLQHMQRARDVAARPR